MSLPRIRLYRLPGRAVWNADTKHTDGRRWQFSTREKDEGAARAFAESKVSAEAGSAGNASSSDDGAAPDAPERRSRSWGERLGDAAAVAADQESPDAGSGSAAPDTPEIDPAEDTELVADVLSMAASVGLQEAIGRAIRRQKWRDGKRVGHYEPGPPNDKCAVKFQERLRERLIVLLGHVRLGPWTAIAGYGIGMAVTMKMSSERVEDVEQEKKPPTASASANGEDHHAAPFTAPAPAARDEDPEDFRRALAARAQ